MRYFPCGLADFMHNFNMLGSQGPDMAMDMVGVWRRAQANPKLPRQDIHTLATVPVEIPRVALCLRNLLDKSSYVSSPMLPLFFASPF
jgi:hypothetical protein